MWVLRKCLLKKPIRHSTLSPHRVKRTKMTTMIDHQRQRPHQRQPPSMPAPPLMWPKSNRIIRAVTVSSRPARRLRHTLSINLQCFRMLHYCNSSKLTPAWTSSPKSMCKSSRPRPRRPAPLAQQQSKGNSQVFCSIPIQRSLRMGPHFWRPSKNMFGNSCAQRRLIRPPKMPAALNVFAVHHNSMTMVSIRVWPLNMPKDFIIRPPFWYQSRPKRLKASRIYRVRPVEAVCEHNWHYPVACWRHQIENWPFWVRCMLRPGFKSCWRGIDHRCRHASVFQAPKANYFRKSKNIIFLRFFFLPFLVRLSFSIFAQKAQSLLFYYCWICIIRLSSADARFNEFRLWKSLDRRRSWVRCFLHANDHASCIINFLLQNWTEIIANSNFIRVSLNSLNMMSVRTVASPPICACGMWVFERVWHRDLHNYFHLCLFNFVLMRISKCHRVEFVNGRIGCRRWKPFH